MILQFYSIAFDAFEAQEKTRGPKLFSSQRFFQNKSITFRTAFAVIPWKITIAPHPRDPPARNTLLFAPSNTKKQTSESQTEVQTGIVTEFKKKPDGVTGALGGKLECFSASIIAPGC